MDRENVVLQMESYNEKNVFSYSAANESQKLSVLEVEEQK